MREPLADVAQQHAQLGVHVELLGSERIVNLLLIACTVARLVAVLGAREVNQAIVGGIFLGSVQIIQSAVGHAVVLEQAAHGEVVGIVLRCGRQHAAHFPQGADAVVHRHVVFDFVRRNLDGLAEQGSDAVERNVALDEVARAGIRLGKAHLQLQAVGVVLVEHLDGAKGLLGVSQLHVGVAIERRFIQVLGLRFKVSFHQLQCLFAAFLGGVVHLEQAHAHIVGNGGVARVQFMGIAQQVIEGVKVVGQLLLLRFHEDVFRLALVSQTDSLADCRRVLSSHSRQCHQR